MIWKVIIIAGGLFFLGLLAYITFYPVMARRKPVSSIDMHPEITPLYLPDTPSYQRIAIAMEFGEHDNQLVAHAIAQGKTDTEYILIHIVESASARMLGLESDDFETRNDEERLHFYVQQLQEKGFKASGHLGFRNRSKEIVRIVLEQKADMLVIGAHRHTGIKDWLYGETINSVRHELCIPVLVVNVGSRDEHEGKQQ